MATELRDSLIKLYLEMPYKNSLNLSPALQKLQKQFNSNSLVKYTWSAISSVTEKNSEACNEIIEEKKVVHRWKLSKSVVSKVIKYSFFANLSTDCKSLGLHLVKNSPFNFSNKNSSNRSIQPIGG